MSGQQADGVYNRRAWSAPTADAPNPPQEYLGPFASNQVKLFPSRYGFTEYEITIEDIVQMPRRGQQRVESDFSQKPNSTQSSSRNTLGGSV
jgi:hypothetical protein